MVPRIDSQQPPLLGAASPTNSSSSLLKRKRESHDLNDEEQRVLDCYRSWRSSSLYYEEESMNESLLRFGFSLVNTNYSEYSYIEEEQFELLQFVNNYLDATHNWTSLCSLEELELHHDSYQGKLPEPALIPNSIALLTNLTSLGIIFNDNLTNLPNNIEKLKNLDEIIVIECRKFDLPELFNLPRTLTRLVISGNSTLRKLPDSVTKLTNLTYLNLSGCEQLDYNGVVEQIKSLQKLTSVDFSSIGSGYDERAKFPSNIGSLKQIKELIIYDVAAIDLPNDIVKITKLEKLDGLIWLNERKSKEERLDEIRRVFKTLGGDFFTKWMLPTIPEEEFKEIGGLDAIKRHLADDAIKD